MTNDEARQYFKDKGLTYAVLTEEAVLLLIAKLQLEIYKAKRNDKDCILVGINKYKYKPGRVFLTVKGTYFDSREAISFNQDGFIGFAGWACTRSTEPFINGFIKWCDAVAVPLLCRELGTEG